MNPEYPSDDANRLSFAQKAVLVGHLCNVLTLAPRYAEIEPAPEPTPYCEAPAPENYTAVNQMFKLPEDQLIGGNDTFLLSMDERKEDGIDDIARRAGATIHFDRYHDSIEQFRADHSIEDLREARDEEQRTKQPLFEHTREFIQEHYGIDVRFITDSRVIESDVFKGDYPTAEPTNVAEMDADDVRDLGLNVSNIPREYFAAAGVHTINLYRAAPNSEGELALGYVSEEGVIYLDTKSTRVIGHELGHLMDRVTCGSYGGVDPGFASTEAMDNSAMEPQAGTTSANEFRTTYGKEIFQARNVEDDDRSNDLTYAAALCQVAARHPEAAAQVVYPHGPAPNTAEQKAEIIGSLLMPTEENVADPCLPKLYAQTVEMLARLHDASPDATRWTIVRNRPYEGDHGYLRR